MAKAPGVLIQADLPNELIADFLQHLRDFDTAHHGSCHFVITISAPDVSVEDFNAILDQVTPGFVNRATIRKQ